MRRICAAAVLCTLAITGLRAEIVDSVVAVVALKAIKLSDVIREVRLTALLNQMPVVMTEKEKADAMDRLIDQAVIRKELDAGSYAAADATQVEAALKAIRDGYGGSSGFAQALKSHSLTEDEVKDHLKWELTVLDFTQLRFGTGAPAAGGNGLDKQENDIFIAWLDTARKAERITTKPERLK